MLTRVPEFHAEYRYGTLLSYLYGHFLSYTDVFCMQNIIEYLQITVEDRLVKHYDRHQT